MLIFWAQKWDIESWVLNGKGLGNRPGSLQASCPLPTASHWPAHKEEWIAPPISINLPLSMTHTPLLSPHSSPLMPPTFISFLFPLHFPLFYHLSRILLPASSTTFSFTHHSLLLALPAYSHSASSVFLRPLSIHLFHFIYVSILFQFPLLLPFFAPSMTH